MVESSVTAWYVPASVSMATPRSDNMAIVVEMMNDRSGLWSITQERVSLLRESIPRLSMRAAASAQEMLQTAASGERLWQTKAEYYAALSEIKNEAKQVSRRDIDNVIAQVARGSRVDGVDDREWVKLALDVLTRISREK